MEISFYLIMPEELTYQPERTRGWDYVPVIGLVTVPLKILKNRRNLSRYNSSEENRDAFITTSFSDLTNLLVTQFVWGVAIITGIELLAN